MAIYDYTTCYSHPDLKMSLTDDGWKIEGTLPTKRKQVEEVYKKYFKPQKSWEGTLFSEGDGLRFTAYFSDKDSEVVESIFIRVTLRPILSQGRLSEIANLIGQIAKDLKLSVFDVYEGRFLNACEDIIYSICNSPRGKQYGYGEYIKYA